MVIVQEGQPSTERAESSAATSDGSRPQTEVSDAARVQNNLRTRKRTKTGCLTCRKRRIKCGEERPTCHNCIKSKRSCEGYTPRLTFKDPLGAYRSAWPTRGSFPYHNVSISNGAAGQFVRPHPGSGTQSHFPVIAPRPFPQTSHGDYYSPTNHAPSSWTPGSFPQSQSSYTAPAQQTVPTQQSSSMPHPSSSTYQPASDPPDSNMNRHGPNLHVTTSNLGQIMPVNSTPNGLVAGGDNQPGVATQWQHNLFVNEYGNHQTPTINSSAGSDATEHIQTPLTVNPEHIQTPITLNPDLIQTPITVNTLNSLIQAEALPEHVNLKGNEPVASSQDPMPSFIPALAHSRTWLDSHGKTSLPDDVLGDGQLMSPQGCYAPENVTIHTTLIQQELDESFPPRNVPTEEAADEDDADDYYDMESDEDDGMTETITSPSQSDLNRITSLSATKDDQTMRSYYTFLHTPNILTNYIPKFTASPLMDPTTARIFCHFITATGPGLSCYERRPVNPAIIFSGVPVPKSQQSLWTYTLPMMALSNQCLLQAILALASLQIARLQQAPLTVAMKHYHFALRKVAKAVSSPSKRTQIATIAATLILGHFEAITAEHNKWSSHLAGAGQLLMEVDFRSTSNRIGEEKARGPGGSESTWFPHVPGQYAHFADEIPFVPNPDGLDENLVSQIMGLKVRYDGCGGIVHEEPPTPKSPLTEKDVDDYQTNRDLFWFFVRMDIIQSLIRCGRLLLPYERWVACPPRAPLGRHDAIYGTMDHLLLLLGRIADFASKDQIRKRRVAQANGGQWRPPGTPASTGRAGHTAGPPSTPASQPSFYGMIPDPGHRLPKGFQQGRRNDAFVPPSPEDEFELELELDAATEKAEREWEDIQQALDLFENSLGQAWQTLAADEAPAITTPFGVALQYRTYNMAGLWSFFYMGRIIAERTKPSMPAASMMAAGIVSGRTAKLANTIGRICFGLQLPPRDQPLNPTYGSALAEMMLPLFFAGVQYIDPHQRAYTIERLRYITENIGQDSASLIAAGLETVWSKMAESGRGPKYEKTVGVSIEYSVNAGSDYPREKGGCRVSKERGVVHLQPDTRVAWAGGVMSLEEDFRELAIAKAEGPKARQLAGGVSGEWMG